MNKVWQDLLGFEGFTLEIRPRKKTDIHEDPNEVELETKIKFGGEVGGFYSKLDKSLESYSPEQVVLIMNSIIDLAKRQFLEGIFTILQGEDPTKESFPGKYEKTILKLLDKSIL